MAALLRVTLVGWFVPGSLGCVFVHDFGSAVQPNGFSDNYGMAPGGQGESEGSPAW